MSELSNLHVIWSSADREVALNTAFMYTYNSKKNNWWQTVRLTVWGPASKLLAADAGLQENIMMMRQAGVELYACKACSDRYGVSEKLEELGIDVIYMGEPLTSMLKNGWATLTF